VQSIDAVLAALDRRRAELGAEATGQQLIDEFLNLARTAIDGYLAPGSGEDVVRVEAQSRPDLHAINVKRQLTWLDADNDPGFAHIYLDMSFERHIGDQGLTRFTVNYDEAPTIDEDVGAVARALRRHDPLQRLLARVPRTVRTWIDGDLPDDLDTLLS